MSDFSSAPARLELFPCFTEIVSFVDRILEHGHYSQYALERLIKRLNPANKHDLVEKGKAFLDCFSVEFITALSASAQGKDVDLTPVRDSLAKAYALALGHAATAYNREVMDVADLATRINKLSYIKQDTEEAQALRNHVYKLAYSLSFLSPTFPAATLMALLSGTEWNQQALKEMSIALSPTVDLSEDSMESLPSFLRITISEDGRHVVIPSSWISPSIGTESYRGMLENIIASAPDYIAAGDTEHEIEMLEISEGDALGFRIGGGNNADTVASLMICNITGGRVQS